MPPIEKETITVNCPHCGTVMDVTELKPFAMAVCPGCEGMSRVRETMGSYVINGKIGVGGVSIVYCAQDSILGREVALKILNETYAVHEERIKRFELEAQIMAKVQHPNMVKIYGVGQAQGYFYIAMELVDGHDLETIMNDSGAIPEIDVLRIAIQMAEGLRAAWSAGMLHRDIKPANVLIDSAGVAKIVDFGLSLLQDQKDEDEAIWVTPFYASPEALLRESEDFHSDMYAIGATLSHLLVGKIPVANLPQNAQDLWEAKKNFPSIIEWYPEVSPMTGRIIDRLMEFRVENRYANYDDLLTDLNHAQDELLKGGEDWLTRRNVLRREGRMQQIKKKILYVGSGVLFLGFVLWGICEVISAPSPLVEEVVNNKPEKATEKTLAQIHQQINETSRLAEELFAKNDLIGAEREFKKLVDNRQCPIELSMWAGVQTSLYSWIKGDMTSGEECLQLVKKRIDDSSPENILESGMIDVNLLINELLGEPSNTLPPSTINSRLAVLSHVGNMLKYWRLARCEVSDAYIKELQKVSKQESDIGEFAREWLTCLAPYLHDLDNLEKLKNLTEGTEEQIARKIRFCDKLLNTKGVYQAPGVEFEQSLVAYRQHLEKLEQEAREKKEIEEQAKEQERERIAQEKIEKEARIKTESHDYFIQTKDNLVNGLKDTWDFENGASEFKKLSEKVVDESEKEDAKIWGLMCARVDQFLKGIAQDIRKLSPNNRTIKLEDGLLVGLLTIEKNQWVILNQREKQNVPLVDVGIRELIKIHRACVALGGKTSDDIKKRHADAIFLLYLIGDKENAHKTANKLSKQDEHFEEEWTSWIDSVETLDQHELD
ncbi:MAG: protein kinase [Akkermansia sp.]